MHHSSAWSKRVLKWRGVDKIVDLRFHPPTDAPAAQADAQVAQIPTPKSPKPTPKSPKPTPKPSEQPNQHGKKRKYDPDDNKQGEKLPRKVEISIRKPVGPGEALEYKKWRRSDRTNRTRETRSLLDELKANKAIEKLCPKIARIVKDVAEKAKNSIPSF